MTKESILLFLIVIYVFTLVLYLIYFIVIFKNDFLKKFRKESKRREMTVQEFLHSKRKKYNGYNLPLTFGEIVELMGDFATLKCKEQRELCARRAWSMQYEFDPITLGIQYDEFIRDSQQPQIFEESK